MGKRTGARAGRQPKVRKGQGSVKLTREEFERRLGERFYDPGFEAVPDEIARISEAAWTTYHEYHKSPRTRRAGAGFADPDHQLPVEWLEAKAAIRKAERAWKRKGGRSRILVVCASPRSDQTCPGEMSKTFRLASIARRLIEKTRGFDCDFLDLSHLTSEYGRQILPCKACVSTAMPLCHWPCSCYPNHALGQVNDWMNELYPRWVRAHGVLIVTPVHWYQVPSVLKLMMDRMVCADGGNPDQTSTHGKTVTEAKALELAGWDYPKHLAGRAFGLMVHGDVAGTEEVRRALTDWLLWMGLVESGSWGAVDRYIGYYEPYATSHDALDEDKAVQEETRIVTRALVNRVKDLRAGTYRNPGRGLEPPRPK